MRIKRVFQNIMALFFLAVFLVACQSEEERLRARVEKYWQLRISRELTQAYEFEYPVFRKKTDLNTYISSRNNPVARYRKAEILSIKFPEKDVAEVEMRFEIETLFPGTKKPFVTEFKRLERWVKINGEWYHVPAQ